jgi:choline dehydrogenase-like flavoprotein
MAGDGYDFVVIGSGTSGAIASCLLQEGGARVLLLEAGREFRTEEFPLPEMDYTAQMFWGGGAEFNSTYNLAFLRARGVGGTSLVNGALMDRFDAVALDDFRAESGVDFLSEAGLDPHYAYAERNIGLQTIPPEHRNRNAHLFIEAMEKCGHQWAPLRRCQTDCATERGNDCISCLGGCHRRSKQTMMDTYIPRGRRAGVSVRSRVFIHGLDYSPSGITLYGTEDGAKVSFTAPKVVLACGAFGNAQLLLRSGFKKRLPMLGEKFAMHPQTMHFAVMAEPVNAHKGVLQGAKSLDPEFRRRGYKLENVFAAPIALAVLHQRTGRDLHRFMRQYTHLACLEVCVRDENTGTLRVNRAGRLIVDKRLTDQDRGRIRAGVECVREMFAAIGAEEMHFSDWSFGLHLMGGCRIGTDGATSVVAPDFQLHGFPNLYTADSSIFPNAPGINPALTIMALTHRMVGGLLGTAP